MKRRRLVIGFIIFLGLAMLAFGQAKNAQPKPEKPHDPVCGLMVEKNPELSADYKDKTYYFCSKADREKFKQILRNA